MGVLAEYWLNSVRCSPVIALNQIGAFCVLRISRFPIPELLRRVPFSFHSADGNATAGDEVSLGGIEIASVHVILVLSPGDG